MMYLIISSCQDVVVQKTYKIQTTYRATEMCCQNVLKTSELFPRRGRLIYFPNELILSAEKTPVIDTEGDQEMTEEEWTRRVAELNKHQV